VQVALSDPWQHRSHVVHGSDRLFFGVELMVEVYLPNTDEKQFLVWLHSYCGQKIASNTVYKFSDGWSYKLYYPALGDQTSVSFTAKVYRAFHRPAANETTETMANNLQAIKIEWHEVDDRLKVTISPHVGAWVLPPLNDLLVSIRGSWPEAISDNWTYAPNP
jgi:hypothetical protein